VHLVGFNIEKRILRCTVLQISNFSYNLRVLQLQHIHLILKVQNTGLFMGTVLCCEGAVHGCFYKDTENVERVEVEQNT